MAVNRGQEGIYVKNMDTGTHQRVDVSIDGVIGDKAGQYGTSLNVSPDGNLVAFTSGSTNLVAGGSSGPQLFVKDLSTGEISIASTSKMAKSEMDIQIMRYLVSMERKSRLKARRLIWLGWSVALETATTNMMSL